MRETFYRETTALLDRDPRTALVLADISASAFADAAAAHPDRVRNVGIREQLMIGVAGGLSLTGLRPFVHSYAPFLVERAWEQIKLDLSHQGASAVLVSVGASHDASSAGRTHQAPGDVALLDTLADWRIHVPGHRDELRPMLRAAATRSENVYIRLSSRGNRRAHAHTSGGDLVPIRHGDRGVVIAVGPMLEPTLAATAGLNLTIAYTNTPRPFDVAGLRALAVGTEAVVLVEPYLAGTSAWVVSQALAGVPHRLLALGVSRKELHRYGTPEDHDHAHGLDPGSLRAAIAVHIGG